MKRDIRALFKGEDLGNKTLPDNHRDEFLEKLKKQQNTNTNNFFFLKIAAVLLITLTVGYNAFYKQQDDEDLTIVAQIEAIEGEYLVDIETEWQNFIAIANDEVLVARFKKKLNELDKDYQEITVEFKNDKKSISVIEILIDNLQTRLQILKDIQKHINIINKENEQYENTI
ncbi:hypothetical protein [Lacinutrix jangbogonensis]|uniref:hypothetical protein n=1 Tax=Lacinutrix jangbogonensis TaxID=1469557 RepID=UPI00053E54B4|nr:hypothetical protein [Lacinutrix jangbogonensis]